MIVAAARRFVTLLAAVVGGTAVLSLLLGLLARTRSAEPLGRGRPATWWAAPSCSAASSSATGGPFRVANEEGMVGLRGPRGVRVASG